jgi:hypothetical protein
MMKIERHTGLHVNASQSVAPAVGFGAASTQRSFESALRDQRQRIASSERASPQRTDARSPTSRSTAERNERRATSTRLADERATPPVDRRQASAAIPCLEDSAIPAFIDRALAARWRRAAGAQSPTCIEVVHAASGSRFLLSQENGIWLLTIQSRAASPEDDDTVVRELRELFVKQGLGPLDVVKL